ncbi:MAG: 6-hydroxymethylpterin diphosphokinase MptE-like protein [Pseudomonadota bacterium]
MAEGTRGPVADPHATSVLEARYRAALDKVPFKAGIYLPTDRVPLDRKASGMERVAEIHNGPLKTVYREKLKDLRRKHVGDKRAFIIGNGPSLNETDLSQLKDEVTFCVNGFFLKMPELDWTPTYYVVEDHLVAEDRAEAINALKGPTKLFPAYLAYCLDPGEDTIFFNHRARERYPHAFDFSEDASKITYTGCTVTFTCMQLAHYMGFQELHLIGVDASYDIPKDVDVDRGQGSTAVLDMASADPNHFHPDYFGKGMRWHDPQVDKMLEAYREARLVADRLGRPIYNATLGGALEVFERRSFARLFPGALPAGAMARVNGETAPEARRLAYARERAEAAGEVSNGFPRVLVLDVVPPGQMTATGELKSTLFAEWPETHLMQVCMDRHRFMVTGGGLTPGASATAAFTDDVIDRLVETFSPELVLFRPVADRDTFNRFAFSLVDRLDCPVALWIVDDWPAHLAETDPEQWAVIGPQFTSVVDRASVRLAISEGMTRAFAERYGKPFVAFSNAVDPRHWPEKVHVNPISDASPLIIRYGGGLSSRMTLQSVIDIAQAVEALSGPRDVRFEINTREHWAGKYGDRFSRFAKTTLTTALMATDAYRRWLQAGDLTVIAYNFDPETVAYVRHSMANKTVECLASGAPPLVYGPSEIHTVDFLERHGLGLRVVGQGPEAVGQALNSVLEAPARLKAMGEAGRAFAFQHRRLDLEQERFRSVLDTAARRLPPSGDTAEDDVFTRLNLEYKALATERLQRSEEAQMGASGIMALGSGTRTGRAGRMVWFYKGWRGALAGVASVLPLLAYLIHAIITGSAALLGGLLAASMTAALGVVFFFVAYLFSLIEDYSLGGRPRGP